MFEENKAIDRRFIDDIIHPHNLDVVEEIYASDYVMHNPAASEEVRGVEGVREFSSKYMNAFPDMEVTVEDQIAEGDKVVTRWTARGTHQGELMGIPPSCHRVEAMGVTISRIEGGKIAEDWDIYDALGIMQGRSGS